MVQGRWEQVKEIVDGALGLTANERRRHLERACGGDRALREEVDSLLRYESDSFMEGTGPGVPGSPESPDMSGRALSHYRVEAEISRGGMGIVYRARDTRLEREVAIKALRPELASSGDRLRRFEQEARAASALNHPSIVHVYDVGEEEGIPYIAMEYVEGATLRERLEGRGPLAVRDALQIARQLVAGLVKAHAAGIVHRDLKPENLMLAGDGQLKILDFGLAKLLVDPEASGDSGGGSLETQEGMILGTARYMSPEQARGRGGVDFRSDQFAFGSILYEMLTGAPAFARDSIAQTMAAIIESEPVPIRKFNREAPAGLVAVASRCLEKDPSRRYASTEELAQALGEVSGARAEAAIPRALAWGGLPLAAVLGAAFLLERDGPPIRSARGAAGPVAALAVLPLVDPSPNPGTEYFADGMTGGLIDSLARIGALRVTSRRSSMRYKATERSLREIGRELDVDTLFQG